MLRGTQPAEGKGEAARSPGRLAVTAVWTEVVAGSWGEVEILVTFQRESQEDLLMDWMRDGRERRARIWGRAMGGS